jgi:peptidoglycan/LPS O-acetylase OafA/YrhL
MFFVISGYVITSSLASRAHKGLADLLLGFYTRRIKRLAGALILCVVMSSISICFFAPNPIASLRTGLASLFGLSNLYLLKQASDYFGTSTVLNIFAHTWSLGVEEQFYFLFPFLVWFTGVGRLRAKGPRNLICVISLLSVASLVAFIHLYRTNQPAAYFLMPTRLWELGAGCLLFLVQRTADRRFGTLSGTPSLALSAAVVVLFMPLQFAVQTTFSAVVITILLIASLRPHTYAYALLVQPCVLHIGLISYSLYLWHWSVITLSRWTIGIHWWSASIQGALIYLFAATSHRYVETPLRLSEWSPLSSKSIAYGLASLSVSALLLLCLLSYSGLLYTGTKVSQQDKKETALDMERGTFLLIGDSHAAHFAELAKEVADELHKRFRLVTEGATPFPTVTISTPAGGLTIQRNAKVRNTHSLS